MNKIPFDQKNVGLNPLIDAVNYLLDKVAELEAKDKPQEIPAILKKAGRPKKTD